MNDLPRQQLAEMVTRYGRELCDDPRRTEALLRDLCGAYRREISVLVGALREGVAADLLGAQDGTPKSLLVGRLARRLEDNLGLAPEAARWAVETWALALGVVIATDLPPARAAPESPSARATPQRPSSPHQRAQPVSPPAPVPSKTRTTEASVPSRGGTRTGSRAARMKPIPPASLAEVRRLLGSGKKIQAIALYRQATGCTLREAKEAVEALAPHANSSPLRPPITSLPLEVTTPVPPPPVISTSDRLPARPTGPETVARRPTGRRTLVVGAAVLAVVGLLWARGQGTGRTAPARTPTPAATACAPQVGPGTLPPAPPLGSPLPPCP